MISQKFVIQQVKKGQNFHRDERTKLTFEPLPFVRSKRQPSYLNVNMPKIYERLLSTNIPQGKRRDWSR